MSFCPNKSNPEYKNLVAELGEANAYNAWFLNNKELLTSDKVEAEPVIPSIEKAMTLLKGINLSVSPRKLPTFKEEVEMVNKKYPTLFGLPLDRLWAIAREINKKYKTIVATVIPSPGNDIGDHEIRLVEKPKRSFFDPDVVNKLQKLFPRTEIKQINTGQAQQMLGNQLTPRTKSFIKGNTVYVIADRVDGETLVEEFLHPFIEYIYQNNRELFDSLYKDARNDKELSGRITRSYKEFTVTDKQKEMVTQKLAELLHNNYMTSEPNTIEQIKTNMKNLYKSLVEFFQKWLGGYVLNVEELPSNMDLEQLANILNTTDLEVPVEYLYQPTFSLLDEISKQSKEGGYAVVGDSYQDKYNNKFTRLTEWVRGLSKLKGKTTADLAMQIATREFQKADKVVKNNIEYIKLPDGRELTLQQVIDEKIIEFETSKAYGTLAHLLIERAIKKLSGEDVADLDIKIKALAEGSVTQNTIDLTKLEWIEKNIEVILRLAGLNIANGELNASEKDKALSEVPYVLEKLGIGTTMDGIIEHPDGTISIKDWKTGRILSDQLSPDLLTEFGDSLDDIRDNKLDRAKLEVVLRALMLKYKNPSMKFRSLSIEYLNKNTLVETQNINLDNYLRFLSNYFQKNDPELFKDLNNKGLFDVNQYALKISEDTAKVFQEKKETIESLDEQITILKNRMAVEKRQDVKDHIKLELTKLTRKRLALESAIPVNLTENGDKDISWFKRYLGNLSSVADPLIRLFKSMLDQANMAFNAEYKAFERELDDITKELLTEHNANWQNLGLKYRTKEKTGLYDFLWVLKDKGTNKGYYRVTENDPEYKNLKPAQKKWVDFVAKKMGDLYNEVASEVVHQDPFGNNVKNSDFNNQPNKLPADFMPRIYLAADEYYEKYGLVGGFRNWNYAKYKNSFFESSFYANNAVEVIPFKYMGSDAIIGGENHSFNGEAAVKMFMQNLLKKKHLDKVHSIGVGLQHSFLNDGKLRAAGFMDDKIIQDVLGVKKRLPYSTKGFSIVKGGQKIKIDIDTWFTGFKGFVTAGTMWLKPFAGLKNGIYTLMSNHKNSVIGSISKRLGIPPEDLNFTESEMLQGDKLWLQYKADVLAGKANTNKLNLLLKEFNYLPEAYDYRVHPTSILSKKNKLLNQDHLYIFHSAFEDWGTGAIFGALLLHNKNPKTGKSLLDSYEVENGRLKWVGGIRGKRADGSLIEGITYEELNKFKKASAAIHGNYREEEKAAIEIYALGRLAMQFKRFVPQQLMNLYQSRQLSDAYGKFVELVDPQTGLPVKDKDGISIYSWQPEVIEGKMRLLIGHLLNVLKFTANYSSPAYQFDKMSNRQKQDLVSAYYIVGSTVIGYILGALAFDDDDEDKWLAQSYYKIIMDLTEGINPLDMLQNFQQQSVSGYKAFKMSKAFGEFFLSVATNDRNKYGKYKGSNELAKVIPPFSTIYDVEKAFNRTKSGENIGLDLGRLKELDWSE
jgi:hypothetical protein